MANDMLYTGGSPYFDELTGRYLTTDGKPPNATNTNGNPSYASPLPNSGSASPNSVSAPQGFPNFGVPFPYPNLVAQLQASMQNPTPGSYKRFGGTGLLAGAPTSNATGPMPGAVQVPSGGYAVPKDPAFVGANKFPVGGLFSPISQVSGVTSAGPADFNGPVGGSTQPQATSGSLGNIKTPMDLKMAGGPNPAMANQAFSSNLMPTGSNVTSAEELHYLQARPNSLHAQSLAALPSSFTPAQFNQVAQIDPVLAEQMSGQMGQAGRNAIMQTNGLTNDQFNSFINQYGSGATPGFGPEQLALLRSLGIG